MEGWRPSREKQMNLHIIVGRVGQDPEVQYLNSGTAVCNLSVATDDPVKDAQGNFTTKATWHRVTFFGRQAESIGEHVRKGRSIAVTGSIRKRKNEETGVVYVDTVARTWEFAGSANGGNRNNGNGGGNNGRRSNTRRGGGQQGHGRGQPQGGGGQQQAPADDWDDDIPF